jgi:hypothetical protein
MDGSLRDVEELCEEMMREATSDIDEGVFESYIHMVIRKDAKGERYASPQVIDMTPLKDAMAERQEGDEAFANALRTLAADLDAVAVISMGHTRIGEKYPLLSLVLEHRDTQHPRVWFAQVLGLDGDEDVKLGPWKEPKDLTTTTFRTILRPVHGAVIYKN